MKITRNSITIDARFFLVVFAFYAPGVFIAIGLWALGLFDNSGRGLTAFLGGTLGFIAAVLSFNAMFVEKQVEPMPLTFRWGGAE